MRIPFRSIAACGLCPVMCVVGLALSGCGGAKDAPELAPASGSITYQGKPLVKAQVVFASETGARVSHGITDENGRYQLGTFLPGDGAVVGKQRVTVVAQGPPRPPPPGTPGAGMPGGPSLPGLPLISEKYFQPQTSGLTAEVRPREDNVFDIELTE